MAITLSFSSCTPKAVETAIEEPEAELSVVELTEKQENQANITLEEVTESKVKNTLKLNGFVDVPPQNMVSISAPMGGYVNKMDMLQGMKVKKGEVLMIIENLDYLQLQQEFLEKKAKLHYLEQEFSRQEQLQKEQINATKTFELAKSELQILKVQIKSLSEKLNFVGLNAASLSEEKMSSKIYIKSPINGYVTTVSTNLGRYVAPTDVLLEIISDEHLHAELSVYEKDIDKIKIGQKAKVHFANDTETKFETEIYLIGKKIEPDKTVRIHAHFTNEKVKLVPGMFLVAELETTEKKALTVSENAVLLFQGKSYVFLETGNRTYEMLEVKTGIKYNSKIEILDTTLKAGQKIVNNGAHALLGVLKNTEEEE